VTDNASYSSVIPAQIGGIHQYIAATDVQVFGVAATDGKVLWRASRPAKNVIPRPYTGTGSSSSPRATISVSTDSGSPQRTVPSRRSRSMQTPGSPTSTAGPSGGGPRVYLDRQRGLLTCLEFKTERPCGRTSPWQGLARVCGRPPHRAERERPRGPGRGDPEGYREKGRFDQPDRSQYNSWPHPVIAGGWLYLRDQDILLCYD